MNNPQATATKVQTIEPVMKHGRPSRDEKEKGDNYNLSSGRGTSASYLTARIARDYPETLEDMKDGKFRSAREAAVSVGIVKKDDRWSAPGPVEKLAALIRKRYSEQQIQHPCTSRFNHT